MAGNINFNNIPSRVLLIALFLAFVTVAGTLAASFYLGRPVTLAGVVFGVEGPRSQYLTIDSIEFSDASSPKIRVAVEGAGFGLPGLRPFADSSDRKVFSKKIPIPEHPSASDVRLTILRFFLRAGRVMTYTTARVYVSPDDSLSGTAHLSADLGLTTPSQVDRATIEFTLSPGRGN